MLILLCWKFCIFSIIFLRATGCADGAKREVQILRKGRVLFWKFYPKDFRELGESSCQIKDNSKKITGTVVLLNFLEKKSLKWF